MSRFLAMAVLLAGLGSGTPLHAQAPLHQRIDELIAAKASAPMSPLANDAEFLRRVWLDLAGRIPTADEARAFLADDSADKRATLIAALLAGDDHPRHMARTFDTMLMERRGEHAEWSNFLRAAFAENRPWDRLVREILHPDAENEATRGSAYFITRRLERYGQQPDDMPGLVRDVGRMFLGIDVQCAQCHDHLFIDDYQQEDYQGLFAFVGQTFIRQDKTFPAVGEKPLAKPIEFVSVFVQEPKSVGPKLPGRDAVAVPDFAPGEEYAEVPDRKAKTPGVLKFSPLKLLAEELPRGEYPAFSRNIVNRLWWLMMGRGLVEPLDQHHSGNPATHPELLDLLADEFVAHGCDVRWLLGELARTETYQRSGRLTDVNRDVADARYLVAAEKRLSAEQLLDSVLVATGDGPPEQHPKYNELLTRFRKALALPEKEPEVEILPSVKGALFFANDSALLALLQPRDQNLTARLAKLDDPGALADELYLSVLTRLPTADERREVAELFQTLDLPREQFHTLLAWSLLASNEFFINH